MKKSSIPSSTVFALSLAIVLHGTLGLRTAGAAEKKSASDPIVLINYDGMQGDDLSNSGTLGGGIPFNRAYTIEEEGPPSGKELTSLKVTGWTETTRSTFEVPSLPAGTIHFWLKPGPPDEFHKNVLDIGKGKLAIYVLNNGIVFRMEGHEYIVDNCMAEDEWVHFAFVFDNAKDEGNIYINGENLSATVAPSDLGGLMAISATGDIQAAAFNGSLGAITILASALSEKEVVSASGMDSANKLGRSPSAKP